jgi:hypothetical protein
VSVVVDHLGLVAGHARKTVEPDGAIVMERLCTV